MMAEKIKTDNKTENVYKKPDKPKKKSGSKFKMIVILLILLILIAVGFALGVYLKIIDTQQLAEKWKLNEHPVIGQYFSPPKTNFETVESTQQSPPEGSSHSKVPAVVTPEAVVPEIRKIDDVEYQKQLKLKQQEEAKRISKVSRLYGSMKPDEAVAILEKMDDETVLLILNKMEDEPVAKIMALFDARRAAILSQSMLRGRAIN